MDATRAFWEALWSWVTFARNMSAHTINVPATHTLCTETHSRVQSDTENILFPDTTTTRASCTRPKAKGSLTSSTSANSSSSTTQDIHPRHHLAIRSSPRLTISCHRLKDDTGWKTGVLFCLCTASVFPKHGGHPLRRVLFQNNLAHQIKHYLNPLDFSLMSISSFGRK